MPRLYPQPHPLAYVALVSKTLHSYMHDQLPPFCKSNFARGRFRFYSNCSERPCLAKNFSDVIFVKYCKVSTHTILPTPTDRISAGTALFWPRYGQNRAGEEVLNCFNLIHQGNQIVLTCSFSYNYYVQLVAIKRDWMRVPNLKSYSARQRGEAGHAIECKLPVGNI